MTQQPPKIKVVKREDVTKDSRRKQAERIIRDHANGLVTAKRKFPDVFEQIKGELKVSVV